MGLLRLAPPIADAANKYAPPAKSAIQYAAYDTHPNEHVTIAADPCDDPKECSFFRLPYIQHGLHPHPRHRHQRQRPALSLDDARIQFISANNDTIPAATEDEINRRLFTLRSTQDIHDPAHPHPHPPHPRRQENHRRRQRIRLPQRPVQAHSTLAGYLFYDIQDLDDPPSSAPKSTSR